MKPIRTILCPVDFSAPSEEAVRYAVSLAEPLGTETIHLLHAYRRPSELVPDRLTFPRAEVDRDVRRDLTRRLEDLAARFSGREVVIETHLVEGAPHRVVAEYVRARNVELVVLGTRGRTGAGHFLLGSVAEKVLRVSPVPVCTVHAPPRRIA